MSEKRVSKTNFVPHDWDGDREKRSGKLGCRLRFDHEHRSDVRTWGDIYNRWLVKGHDHGSAAEKADAWERRVLSGNRSCTSTHCERRQECASPSECSGDFNPSPSTVTGGAL